MKTLKTMILGVGAVALLGASGLSAQTRAIADIPFEFTVQNTTLPAGEYTMSATSTGHDLMLIQNVKAHQAIIVLAPGNRSEYKGTNDKNVVLFHRIENRYFLAEVQTDAVRGHVGPSKLERELASEGSSQPLAAVIIPALSIR
ncbi:MAG TPA: hypothetical protein VKR61_06895 [Bryobacteraceae bacterium]|nr:hypothetical protein [Bryobacteraceae bacterium]